MCRKQGKPQESKSFYVIPKNFFSFMLVTKELKKYLKPSNSMSIKQKQLASSENCFLKIEII